MQAIISALERESERAIVFVIGELVDHPRLAFAGVLLLVLGLAILFRLKVKTWLSPSWEINGPRPDHWLTGNLPSIIAAEPGVWHDEQSKAFGRTFRYTAFGGESRIYSTDPRFFNHIMSSANAYRYPKPPLVRSQLAKMLGDGLLVTEGDIHKRQRRIISPAFSALSIKPLVPIFLAKAEELRAVFLARASELASGAEDDDLSDAAEPEKVKAAQACAPKGDGLIDVMAFLGRATLDVIGLAGFNYDFGALQQEADQQENELANAFKEMFKATTQITFFGILSSFVPFPFAYVPTERKRTVDASLRVMNRVGGGIIQKAKASIAREVDNDGEKAVTKSDVDGRDVISMLIRANMASDVAASQRLTDAEVLAQVTTFMLAGYETSSTALTWTLHLLAENPEIQDRLRAELLAVPETEPDMDLLHGLPFLDAVVRESLRVLAPVSNTVREAAVDDVIPLSEPIVSRDGKELKEITVAAGETVFVGILNMNRAEEIWGQDAAKFRPDRWLDGTIPETASSIEAPWAHIATFLAGPRGCIGYRFALLEIKAFLFVLLRSIEFNNPTPALHYIHRTALVQRPLIKDRESEGYQMRLKLSKV